MVAISSTTFFYISSLHNDSDITDSLDIASLRICGNTTDILYPELAEANFEFLENGNWLVNAHFVNDSAGYYEYLEIYDLDFTITSEELEPIDDALYEGLNQTYSSNISILMLLEPSPSIWYDIEITYTDGSWIYITAFQTETGHIIFNSGTGTPDLSLMNGSVLEPLSALDCLVTAIYNFFSNHID